MNIKIDPKAYKVEEEVVTTTTKTITLTGDMILRLFDLPVGKGVKVYVPIPGGGDYSNMDLPLTLETPLTITWKEES